MRRKEREKSDKERVSWFFSMMKKKMKRGRGGEKVPVSISIILHFLLLSPRTSSHSTAGCGASACEPARPRGPAKG